MINVTWTVFPSGNLMIKLRSALFAIINLQFFIVVTIVGKYYYVIFKLNFLFYFCFDKKRMSNHGSLDVVEESSVETVH